MISLDLYQNITKGSDHVMNLKPHFQTWKRSIRAIGGYWFGDSLFAGEPWQMSDFFHTALMKKVVESVAGRTTWQGFIGEMILTYSNGDRVVRSVGPFANRVKVIYSKIYPNLFTDGSAESSTWTAEGTPTTHAASTDPYWHGTQSWHVVTDAADEGTFVDGAAVSITAGIAYDVRFDVRVDSGTWILYVYDTGTTDVVAQRASANDGEEELKLQIPESNTATSVDVKILETSGSGEIYIDAGSFRQKPNRASTPWYIHASSVTEFTPKELIISTDGRSDESARALGQNQLAKRQWPRTRGTEDPIVIDPSAEESENKPVDLAVSAYGYVDLLRWIYAKTTQGTDTATNHITNLLGETSWISAGKIATNATNHKLDVIDVPTTLWDAIEQIIEAGEDGDTTPYTGGVYNWREFVYEKRPTTVSMYRKGNQILGLDMEPIEPYNVKPGLIQFLSGSERQGASGLDQDRPDVQFIREVEYDMASNTVRLIRERDRHEP
jgi:hypothetical protein